MNTPILRSPNLAEGGPVHVIRLYECEAPSCFRDGGLVGAARSVRSAGRGGDEVLLHINPREFEFLKSQWGEPSRNPHTGLPEYGLFSKLKKALKFEKYNVKGIVKDIAKNPQRLLVGAVDPIGTKIANKVLGTNWDPAVNQLGGATKKRFADAEAEGIDTGTAKTLHGIASAIAGFYGGNALGNLASTGLGNVAQGLQTTANANTLSPAITTAQYTGDTADFIAPVVTQAQQAALTQAGQAAANAAADSNLTGTLAQVGANAATKGASALSNVGDKAIDYAKKPANWETIGKGLALVGALGGGAGQGNEPTPPAARPGEPLPDLSYGRQMQMPALDWYSYGERPESSFYADNTLPAMPGKARGGSLRHVRGPGSGRSDSIPARLSDGEYVFTAEDVSMLGDGSNAAGARRLDQWRTALRKHKGSALAKGEISPNAKPAASYLRGAR